MTPNVLFSSVDFLDGWLGNLWQASWQGGLVALIVWSILRLLPSMPARCQCWFWRLALLKFAVVLFLPTLLTLPLLPAPEVRTPVEVQVPVVMAPVHPIVPVQHSIDETVQWPSLSLVFCVVWLFGAGFFLLRFVLAWKSVRQWKRRSGAITEKPILV